MNAFRKRIAVALVLVAGMLAGSVAGATPITMDFDGLTPLSSINTYYNGGCTRLLFKVNCNGPDDGVVWKHARVGDSGHAPSPRGFAGLVFNSHATMNVAAGFESALSFDYYSLNPLSSASVSIYSGINGHGTRLADAQLDFSVDWDFFDLSFDGLAKSVIFSGTPGYLTGFDNVTLGADLPNASVPEPAALGMFGLGVLLIGLFSARRRRHNGI